MAGESDGSDDTVARPAGGAGSSKGEALPVEAPGRYAQAGGDDPELGRGGMGRVLRLEDVHLKREVALKELLREHHPTHGTSGPGFVELFVREAQVLARLEHPGVVPVYELGRRADGTPYYVMRKVRGQALSRALEAAATLEERLALLPHLVDVAHTVGYAHSLGVVHRDLKPANVMVGGFGETLVVDWGLALVDGEDPTEGRLAGTPAYMSPEQVAGQRLDARTDVWSLGVMLYEVLTARLPFEAPTATEVLNRIQRDTPPAVHALEKAVPKPLAEVVAKALQRDPNGRYADGEALALALAGAMRSQRPRAWWGAVAAGLALVGLLAATVVAVRQRAQAEGERDRHRVEALDARRARHRQLAESAALLLRADELVEAQQLVTAALSQGAEPLARGVQWLLRERGVPTQRWRAPVEAGCARLAVTQGQVLCSTLNGVERFEAATGAALPRLSAGPTAGWLPAVAALGGGLVVAGADNRALFVWALGEPGAPRTEGFPASITSVAPGAGGVFVGLRNGEVYRQGPSGERTLAWTVPGRVRALAADGARLAVANDARVVVREGAAELGIDRAASALAFGPDGALYAGVERSVMRLPLSGEPALLSGHRDAVTAIAAGARLASGDAEGSVRVWRDDGRADVAFRAFSPGVQALTWSEDGALLVVAPRGRSLEAWSVPRPPQPLPDDGVPTLQRLSPGGALVTGLRDGRLRRLDPGAARVLFLEARHEGAVRAFAEVPGAVRPEAARFLSGGEDGQVLAQRWSGQVDVLQPASSARVTALDVSPDGARAAWALDDGSLVLLALAPGQVVHRRREHVVRALRFSPDSRTLVVARDDKRVLWLSAEDGKDRSQLEGLDAPVVALEFCGRDLALGLADGHVKQWGADARRVVRTFTQPDDRVMALAVSADASLLAAGSDDGHVYVWELGSGALLADVPADAGELQAVAFDEEGALLAAGTDRRLHRWGMRP
ncbi:MAG: protein kinase [Myxococcaceae bacterium]|nr:protein kinase [Myxococcaceae bacterium]